MKTLILTAFLTLTMNAFAEQTHNVDCSALSESTERVGKDISDTPETKASKEVQASKK